MTTFFRLLYWVHLASLGITDLLRIFFKMVIYIESCRDTDVMLHLLIMPVSLESI